LSRTLGQVALSRDLLGTGAMSVARPVFKKVTLMLTRRVHGRVFRLLPNKKTDQVVQYVVAVMAKKWRIEVHAIIVMGNHWHVVISDPDGNSVDFKRDCHSFIARAINAGHGDFEALWSSEPTSTVRCVEPDDMIGKIAYTMANPAAARLVMHGHSWPVSGPLGPGSRA
jgi:hypothetical protein